MSRSINEMEPGDYVRGTNNVLYKIHDVWGISKRGRLAKPSWGGFWVETESGGRIGMFEAKAYYKATDKEIVNEIDKQASNDNSDIGSFDGWSDRSRSDHEHSVGRCCK